MQHRSGPKKITGRYTLVESLKFHKPAIVVAFDQEGEELARVNVPDVRNKHARVIESLEGIDWAKCQLLDKRGGHLGVHHRTSDDRDPATELETLMPSKFTAETSAMVNIMLRAQDTVLARHERAMQPLLDAHVKILETAMKRLDLLEQQYEHAMTLNHQLSQDLVGAQLALADSTSAPDVGEDGEPRSRSQQAADDAARVFIPQIARAIFSGGGNGKAKPEQVATAPKNGVSPKKPKHPAQPPPTEPPTS